MTAVVDARRVVAVPELQRAWRAVQAGKFRQESPAAAAKADVTPNSRTWAPRNAEQVLPVVACAAASGASTSLSRWRAPPDAPRGFSNAAGPVPVWQRPVQQNSAHIHRVGGAAYAELFYSKELAAF